MKWAMVMGLLLASAPAIAAAKIDTMAPPFELKNSHGQTRRLGDYRGKLVFIDFWASWCAPCQQELPELDRLAREYKGRGLRVIAINVDEDRRAGEKTLARLGLTPSAMDVLWDTGSQVVARYDIPSLPASFLIDSSGTVRRVHSGFHPGDPAIWRDEIALLAGQR